MQYLGKDVLYAQTEKGYIPFIFNNNKTKIKLILTNEVIALKGYIHYAREITSYLGYECYEILLGKEIYHDYKLKTDKLYKLKYMVSGFDYKKYVKDFASKPISVKNFRRMVETLNSNEEVNEQADYILNARSKKVMEKSKDF